MIELTPSSKSNVDGINQYASFPNKLLRKKKLAVLVLMIPSSNVSAFYAVTVTPLCTKSKFGGLYRSNMKAPPNVSFSTMDSDRISHGGQDVVDELLENVQKGSDRVVIQNLMSSLSPSMHNINSNDNQTLLSMKTPSLETNEASLFEPLLGFYNVSYTLTSRPNDNPVGGKWTRLQGRLWAVKRTMQHVLPPSAAADGNPKIKSEIQTVAVAEVVNAIRLECLWGLLSIWILLRGDAIPLWKDQMVASENDKLKTPPQLQPGLSDRTVKVYFDQPRIGVSLYKDTNRKTLPLLRSILSLGPTSSVVLDSPYVDDRIRLGKGGVSGSQFVFRRVAEDDKEAKDEWRWVLSANENKKDSSYLTKKKLLTRVGALGIFFGFASNLSQQRWFKLGTGISAVISSLSFLWLMLSTGGIETGGDTYIRGK